MFKATWRNLTARKLRLAMSAFAIVLGVGFVAGSFVFTDTLGRSFDGIVKGTTGDVVVEQENAIDEADSTSGADVRTIERSVVDDLAMIEGADRADGNLTVGNVFVVGSDDKLVGGQGPPSFAVNFSDEPAITGKPVLSLTSGRAPEGTDEILLDDNTAERAGYEVGDEVPLVTNGEQSRLTATLVGTAAFGEGSLAGATLVVFDTQGMQDLFFDRQDVYTDVWVTAQDGVGQSELRDSAAAVIPDGLVARTGDDVAKDTADGFNQALSFISIFLLVFAAVALVVGSFLIVNTFSILVAQRSRELALLRALGATRRQVTRSVLVEALIVGFFGSTVGLGLGFGVALGIKALLGALGAEIETGGLVFQPRTAWISYAVGMIVTVVAAYLPARRAAKIAPVAAMRDDVAMPESSLRLRVIIGTLMVVAGSGLMAAGLIGSGGSGALLVGLGVLGVLLGVALLSPVVGRPVLRGLGLCFRGYGTVGRLATQNSLRNPRRTAATASALMIGLALVATMSVLGQSTKASTDKLIEEQFQSDYVISNVVGVPFSPSIADQAAEVEGVDSVARMRLAQATVDGESMSVTAIDPGPYAAAITTDMAEGALTDLGPGEIVVSDTQAGSDGIGIGDQVTLGFPAGEQALEVAAIYESSPSTGTGYLVDLQTLRDAGLQPVDTVVFVDRAPGASGTEVRAALDGIVKDVPTVTLQDQGEFKQAQVDQINTVLYLIYALLLLAIVIAVLGIVNTLALSVIERTREVGLLRAVGMSRRQLRRMVRLEAVAIAVLGAVLGVVMGVVFGIVLQQAIADQGITELSVPVVQLAIFVVLAAVVGVLAALLPARRAARLDVLRAITTE